MARLARAEISNPSEIVALHLIGKTVRSCYLLGFDERSGKNFDHSFGWDLSKNFFNNSCGLHPG